MSKSTPTPRTTVYRTRDDFQAAFGACTGLKAGQPAFTATLQVITHLAWKSPAGSVGWHNGTNANMVANAAAMGITPGRPVAEAMAAALKALTVAAGTDKARTAAAAALTAAAV